MESKETIEESLNGFYGTDGYHATTFNILQVTDGINYLREAAECHWLIDIVESVQHLSRIRENSHFILWIIDVKDRVGTVTALTDSPGTGEVLYKQTIPYTDFPLEHFEFYQEGDVLLLKGEH